MTSIEAVQSVIEALDRCGIPYLLVGSLSSNFYGIARSTNDADFVVELRDASIADLARELGPEFRLDPQMSFETVTGTTRWRLEPVDVPFMIELFELSNDPHDQERFRRRRRVKIAGRETSLPTALTIRSVRGGLPDVRVSTATGDSGAGNHRPKSMAALPRSIFSRSSSDSFSSSYSRS